jgi:hypothetical protein
MGPMPPAEKPSIRGIRFVYRKDKDASMALLRDRTATRSGSWI